MQRDIRPLPRFVQHKRAKGHDYFYFRWQDVYRSLPDNPDSEAFRVEYAKALASIAPERERPIIAGSVRGLIRDYKNSPEWSALAPKTQADYARVIDYLRPIGDFKADNVRRQHVIRIRNNIGSNTRTQDLFVQAVSRTRALHPGGKAPAQLSGKLYVPRPVIRHRRERQADSRDILPAQPACASRCTRLDRPALPRSAPHDCDCARRPRRVRRRDSGAARTPDPTDGRTLHEEGQPEAPSGHRGRTSREGLEQMMNLGNRTSSVKLSPRTGFCVRIFVQFFR
jgi:hypothetical protein